MGAELSLARQNLKITTMDARRAWIASLECLIRADIDESEEVID